jgi:predicted branched-subunit amino acid permease
VPWTHLGAAPGLAAWGLMTGVAMVNSGLSTFEALLMGVIVFAGSSQLAAIPLIAVGCADVGGAGDRVLRQSAICGL